MYSGRASKNSAKYNRKSVIQGVVESGITVAQILLRLSSVQNNNDNCSPITIGVAPRFCLSVCAFLCTKSVSIRLGVAYAHKWIESSTVEQFQTCTLVGRGCPCPLAVYSGRATRNSAKYNRKSVIQGFVESGIMVGQIFIYYITILKSDRPTDVRVPGCLSARLWPTSLVRLFNIRLDELS